MGHLATALVQHPGIGHSHVRELRLDRFEQGAEVAAGRDDLDIAVDLDQPPDALPNSQAVVRMEDAIGIWRPHVR
jgi:hypothetical protein